MVVHGFAHLGTALQLPFLAVFDIFAFLMSHFSVLSGSLEICQQPDASAIAGFCDFSQNAVCEHFKYALFEAVLQQGSDHKLRFTIFAKKR